MKKSPPQIFDRARVRLRRQRSAKAFSAHDFLHRRVMEDIIDRLETVKRDFPTAIFSGAGDLTDQLTAKSGVGEVFLMDSAKARLSDGANAFVADDELLPIAPASVDLFVSVLVLHASNDLVGALAQARLALKPDGLFIAAIFGEETLQNIKHALYTAETEITGGVSPRLAPFGAIQDFGQALSRAGFAMPVTDIDKVTVRYTEPYRLLKDLRGMGETNALANGPAPLRRDIISRTLEIFAATGGEEKFDIVYLTGWAPHPDQQKPLKPGSAKTSLADAIKNRKD